MDEENYITRRFMTLLHPKYDLGDHMKKIWAGHAARRDRIEMVRACGT
jgi:hypothetical protein